MRQINVHPCINNAWPMLDTLLTTTWRKVDAQSNPVVVKWATLLVERLVQGSNWNNQSGNISPCVKDKLILKIQETMFCCVKEKSSCRVVFVWRHF